MAFDANDVHTDGNRAAAACQSAALIAKVLIGIDPDESTPDRSPREKSDPGGQSIHRDSTELSTMPLPKHKREIKRDGWDVKLFDPPTVDKTSRPDQISLAASYTISSMSDLEILTGDSSKILPLLCAESIQCCVTSPPYWGLRDYDHPAQIGAEPSPEEYIENLVKIFREVRRILKSDGLFFLNVGDGYARNGGTGKCGPNAMVGNTKRMIQKRNCKVPDCWGLKDRDLMGLPWRVAFALQADGWILRSKITWIKKTAMPESVKNRPTTATEDVFMFSKSPTYFYDPNGVREESGANLRNYWILGPDITGNGHPATFPRELARGASCSALARATQFLIHLEGLRRPASQPTNLNAKQSSLS